MRKVLKKFLCMVAFAMLTVVCTRAYDYTVGINMDEYDRPQASRLLRESGLLPDGRTSSDKELKIRLGGLDRFTTEVKLWDECGRFAILVVKGVDLEHTLDSVVSYDDIRFTLESKGQRCVLGTVFKIVNAQTGVVRSCRSPMVTYVRNTLSAYPGDPAFPSAQSQTSGTGDLNASFDDMPSEPLPPSPPQNNVDGSIIPPTGDCTGWLVVNGSFVEAKAKYGGRRSANF